MDSSGRRPESGDVSGVLSLPEATERDNTIMTDTSATSTRRNLSLLLGADAANDAGDVESDSETTTYHEESDRLCPSHADDSEYHGSSSSTPRPIHQEATNQSWLSGADEVGGSRSPEDHSTHGNDHVIDQYSFLSDAGDADTSGTVDKNPFTSTPHRQVNELSLLPDASKISDTTIKMESDEASSSIPRPCPSEASEVESSAHLTEGSGHSDGVEHNNLFFRKDDGSVLAIRINPTLGPELLRLLRGLSQQIGPPAQLSALPFTSTASTTIDDDLESNVQELSLTANASIPPRSSAPARRRKATVSSNAFTHASGPSAAISSMTSSVSSTEGFNTSAWIDGIFSSVEGKPYDRDWMRVHNVEENKLKGVPSKHKLDQLVRHGAVVVGDKFCVTYHSSGDPVTLEGEVTPGSTSSNLCVRIAPARAGFDGILRSIQGPKDLIVGMNKEYAARYDHAVQGGWKDVKLRSSTGQDVGTLFDVRQAYQLWADQKAEWLARTS